MDLGVEPPEFVYRPPADAVAAFDRLNPRQRKFVQELFLDPNVTRAALKAGYSPPTAYQQGHDLLKQPDVQLVLADWRRARAERTQIDGDWVVDQIVQVYLRCMEAVPILDDDGEETGRFKFDSKGATKALDMLMKHTGGYLANNVQRKMSADEAEELLRQRLGSDIIERLRGGRRAPPLPAAREEGAGPAGANGVH